MMIGGIMLYVIDIQSPVLAIIFLGAIICGIAFVYFFGVRSNSKYMSNVYVYILLILIIIQIAFSPYIYFTSHDIIQFIVDGYTKVFYNRENEASRSIINTVQEEVSQNIKYKY